jgi:poly-gamma-glutamate synthesis protein (capsule biosynthesis protein)
MAPENGGDDPLGLREPLSATQLRRRREAARRRATVRRRIAALTVVALVALGFGAWIALAGGHSSNSPSASQPTNSSGRHAAAHRRVRPVKFTVEASGDLLIHSPVWERALELGGGTRYNFAALFAQIKPIIEHVDLPLCHVETPMTPAPPLGYPVFNTPPALAPAIRETGFKACSTAATHSLDQGQIGVDDTIRALDHARVLHAGTYLSAAAQRRPLIMTIKGIEVAFLSYTDITNGIPSPHPWSVNRASAGAILAEARRARREGARVVIVNIHWGDENVTQPSPYQLKLAGALTRSPDITAIVGQHVHVVQPIRKINGKLVVFGEGNLISNQTSACCPEASQDGLIAILTIVVDQRSARVAFVHYVPIWVQHPTFVVLPVGRGLRVDPADAAELRASYARTVAAAGRGPQIQPIPAHLPS